MTPQALQQFQDHPKVWVKFANYPSDGAHYANTEYDDWLEDLPTGWAVSEHGSVVPQPGYSQNAYRLSSHAGEIVAVEHETGPEFLALLIDAYEASIPLIVAIYAGWQSRRSITRLRDRGKDSPNLDGIVIRSGDKEVRISATKASPEILKSVLESIDT